MLRLAKLVKLLEDVSWNDGSGDDETCSRADESHVTRRLIQDPTTGQFPFQVIYNMIDRTNILIGFEDFEVKHNSQN